MKFEVISVASKTNRFGAIYTAEVKSLNGKYSATLYGKHNIGDIVDHYHSPAAQRVSNRLSKIGIQIEIGCNLPWIYLEKVNGVKIMEKKNANHGFCIGYTTRPCNLLHRRDLFRKIREIVGRGI